MSEINQFAEDKRRNVETAEFTEDGKYRRRIRSFVLRTGRLSKHQKEAMENHWEHYGLDYQDQAFDFHKIYSNDNPVVLEIGFGMGKSLVQMAQENPQLNYLGIEVHTPGVGACIADAQKSDLKNLRVICHDAVEVLENAISDSSLTGLQLFFPDPWHKAKHHKRRIVQPNFLALILPKIHKGGFVHMATDWQNYAEHMLEVLTDNPLLENQSSTGDYIERPISRPLTKFEQRGHRLGHGVWDLFFIKK